MVAGVRGPEGSLMTGMSPHARLLRVLRDRVAESRGGRRPAVVRVASGLRFVGVNIGATSVDVAVTDGELEVLEHVAEGLDVRHGPQRVLGRVVELVGKLREQGQL